MQSIRKQIAAAALAVGLIGAGTAGAVEYNTVNPYGPGGYYWNYHEVIEKMSAEDKSKLMSMSDKIMQSELDFKMQVAKLQAQHEMDVAKMQRDMEMYLMSYRMGH